MGRSNRATRVTRAAAIAQGIFRDWASDVHCFLEASSRRSNLSARLVTRRYRSDTYSAQDLTFSVFEAHFVVCHRVHATFFFPCSTGVSLFAVMSMLFSVLPEEVHGKKARWHRKFV